VITCEVQAADKTHVVCAAVPLEGLTEWRSVPTTLTLHTEREAVAQWQDAGSRGHRRWVAGCR
jgi:hypothetical protein